MLLPIHIGYMTRNSKSPSSTYFSVAKYICSIIIVKQQEVVVGGGSGRRGRRGMIGKILKP